MAHRFYHLFPNVRGSSSLASFTLIINPIPSHIALLPLVSSSSIGDVNDYPRLRSGLLPLVHEWELVRLFASRIVAEIIRFDICSR